jgi:hypothetical protein
MQSDSGTLREPDPRLAVTVVLVFLATAVVKFVVDRELLFDTPLLSPLLGDILDASVTGVLAAFAIGIALKRAREQRIRIQNELDTVAELNHHVRNSLQIILGTETLRTEPAQRILESVRRIERAIDALSTRSRTSMR